MEHTATADKPVEEASMKKDIKDLLRRLVRSGYSVRMTRSNHWMVSLDGQLVTVLPGTPSDWRSYRNSLADLKRAGFRSASGVA